MSICTEASRIENSLIEEFLGYLGHERHCSPYTAKCYGADLFQFREFLVEGVGEAAGTRGTAGGPGRDSGGGGTGLAVMVSRSAVAPTTEIAFRELLLDTTTEDVEHFLASLSERAYSANTMARKLSALRSFFKFCRKRSYVEYNPPALIPSPKREHRPRKSLEENGVRRLLDAPDVATLLGARDQAMLETMHATGARAAELVDLNIQDLDPAGQTLHIRGRGRRDRTAPLAGDALASVQRYLEMRKAHRGSFTFDAFAMFINKYGQRLSSRSLRRTLDKYLALTGLDPTISPHTLRQDFAARMLDGGADQQSVQKMLGHLSSSCTLAHAHTIAEQQRGSHDKADLLFMDAARLPR